MALTEPSMSQWLSLVTRLVTSAPDSAIGVTSVVIPAGRPSPLRPTRRSSSCPSCRLRSGGRSLRLVRLSRPPRSSPPCSRRRPPPHPRSPISDCHQILPVGHHLASRLAQVTLTLWRKHTSLPWLAFAISHFSPLLRLLIYLDPPSWPGLLWSTSCGCSSSCSTPPQRYRFQFQRSETRTRVSVMYLRCWAKFTGHWSPPLDCVKLLTSISSRFLKMLA